jgi:[ribosomal protein S18]-alanine N-acetyltransferase
MSAAGSTACSDGDHDDTLDALRQGSPVPTPLIVRELTRQDAAAISAWRYPGRYATYDFDDPSELADDHWAVCQDMALIGYCCLGKPARVGDATAEPGTVDLGYGLAPELMGSGLGRRFVEAVVAFALGRHQPRRLRLFILEWNERSRATAERLGFVAETTLTTDEGRFIVMVRPA